MFRMIQLLFLMLIGAVFAVMNPHPVPINIFPWGNVQFLSLRLAVLAALISGLCMGSMLFIPLIFKLKKRLYLAERNTITGEVEITDRSVEEEGVPDTGECPLQTDSA